MTHFHMKIPAIVNSKCLNRLKARKAAWLLENIRNRLGAEVYVTEYKGHAYHIAKKCEDSGVLISVGGDGTAFEIINAIDLTRCKLGIIPIGVGNSLGHDLGITSLEKALDMIERAKAKDIDIGEVTFQIGQNQHRRYFAATTGIGFFADIVKRADGSFKGLGNLCYLLANLFEISRRKPQRCEISLNGLPSKEIEFRSLLIDNTAHSAHMRMFEEASLTDGRLNAWITKINTFGQLLWNIGIITRTYFYDEASKFASRRISIRLKRPANLMLDGEFFDSITAAEFYISDCKLSVFA